MRTNFRKNADNVALNIEIENTTPLMNMKNTNSWCTRKHRCRTHVLKENGLFSTVIICQQPSPYY